MITAISYHLTFNPWARRALWAVLAVTGAIVLGECNEGGWSQEGDDVTWRH